MAKLYDNYQRIGPVHTGGIRVVIIVGLSSVPRVHIGLVMGATLRVLHVSKP